MTCKSCKFWDNQIDFTGYAASYWGLCRRRAPVLSIAARVEGEDGFSSPPSNDINTPIEAHWPMTSHTDWCGDRVAEGD